MRPVDLGRVVLRLRRDLFPQASRLERLVALLTTASGPPSPRDPPLPWLCVPIEGPGWERVLLCETRLAPLVARKPPDTDDGQAKSRAQQIGQQLESLGAIVA